MAQAAFVAQYARSVQSQASKQALRVHRPIVHRPARPWLEAALSIAGIMLTGISALFFSLHTVNTLSVQIQAHALRATITTGVLVVIFFSLTYGNLVYLWARLGYFRRIAGYRREPTDVIESIYQTPEAIRRPITFLLPSYKEELHVIRKSMLSCALQDYPSRRVVLLIDNPPEPTDPDALLELVATRHLPKEISELLAPIKTLCQQADNRFQALPAASAYGVYECMQLAELHCKIAAWMQAQARAYPIEDHADALFVDFTFMDRAQQHLKRADWITHKLVRWSAQEQRQRIQREYRRLAAAFQVEITSFERKQYLNLSHAPNKAMNLNSYISLIGGHYRTVMHDQGTLLKPCLAEEATFSIPETEFVVTLDADSVLAYDYALRLTYELGKPEHQRVAVIQTPYCAIPHAASNIEQTAGATVDMQYIINQGFTKYNASFWIGANAMIRHTALQDIAQKDNERGFSITRYIQDRTVIEDTESSIDLVGKGWKLHNYLERLSYSSTPPDFGALIIQRRRWANGGLLILPNLLRYLLKQPWSWSKAREGWFRLNYLIGIPCSNISMLAILVYPFGDAVYTWWLPFIAVPYYGLYARDLVQSGYPWYEILRVYAINLLLIPINLSGVKRSLIQMVTNITLPFDRTPKVSSRTHAPVRYTLAEIGLLLYCVLWAVLHLTHERFLFAGFAITNALFFSYAILGFIGLRPTRWLKTAFEPATDSERKQANPQAALTLETILPQPKSGTIILQDADSISPTP